MMEKTHIFFKINQQTKIIKLSIRKNKNFIILILYIKKNSKKLSSIYKLDSHL
jgi:hypothetical protein